MFQTFILAAAAAALSACSSSNDAGDGEEGAQTRAGGAVASCTTRAYEEIGGPFELTTHEGQRVTQEDFKGRPTLIYFGFTYCPDVCPSTLVSIGNAYRQLPDGIEPPQTLLITVDPERDTPEQLASYVESNAFPDNLVGLTGSVEDIEKVAEEFFIGFERIETPESLAGYTMDHTSLLYLMDENWKLKTFFAEANTNSEDMATCLGKLLGS
ncbi:MAG: SCO family protein [Henriciella sp.]|uniref:SCO family protein n=1 Tax=Henriciella sp. TaxID=1968823 RepID=UPI003C79409D